MEHSLASALGAPKQPRGDKGSSVTNSNRGLIQTMMAVGVGVGRALSTVLILVAMMRTSIQFFWRVVHVCSLQV